MSSKYSKCTTKLRIANNLEIKVMLRKNRFNGSNNIFSVINMFNCSYYKRKLTDKIPNFVKYINNLNAYLMQNK